MTVGIQPEPTDTAVRAEQPSHVTMALLNLKGGAMLEPGRYDFDRLERIAAQLSTPPAYFGLCISDPVAPC